MKCNKPLYCYSVTIIILILSTIKYTFTQCVPVKQLIGEGATWYLHASLFREGQGIVAQGHLTDARTIEAFEVLAKHDEEYMPPEVAEALKGIEHIKPEYSPEQLQGSRS